MKAWDALGYLASSLVVAAFCMRDIVPLRIAALGSNIAFLAYGIALGLAPVWSLHAVLLPVNGWRLWEAISPDGRWLRPALKAVSSRKPRNNEKMRTDRDAAHSAHVLPPIALDFMHLPFDGCPWLKAVFLRALRSAGSARGRAAPQQNAPASSRNCSDSPQPKGDRPCRSSQPRSQYRG
jgi:hypothetical protein